jgi:hypothetical protein
MVISVREGLIDGVYRQDSNDAFGEVKPAITDRFALLGGTSKMRVMR